MTVPTLTPRSPVVTPTLGPAAFTALQTLAYAAALEYDVGADIVDATGTVIDDLTPWIVADTGNRVARNMTATLHGALNLTLLRSLRWGADLIAPYLLIRDRAQTLLGGAWQRFPLGHFVATSPTLDLHDVGRWAVTGYDKLYLLQSDLADAITVDVGALYVKGVRDAFVAAGLIAAATSDPVADLETVAVFPGDWSAKTVPATGQPYVYTPGGSQRQYLDVVNDLLNASGMAPLFTDQIGQFTIIPQTPGAADPVLWVFAGGETTGTPAGWPWNSCVVDAGRSLTRDVYNVPNQWVFIQQGLTFAPTEGAGQYTVNNVGDGPSSQSALGRVRRSTQLLNASGQTDLVTQGDAIVAAQKAQAETLALSSVPWPAAWHRPVFQYVDPNLPDATLRKVQAQQWSLPLNGDPMTWQASAVGVS